MSSMSPDSSRPIPNRCCGTSFCQTCIQRLQANPCPKCNGKFDVVANLGLKRSLNQLDVYCIHRKDGCDWKGELGEVDKHLNENPSERNLGLGCQYADISCVYQCGEKFQRHTIQAHVDSCQMKPLTCSHCHEYKSTFEDIVNNHWPECRCYPVPCPNECGIGTLQRQNLDHHLNKECPLGVSRETEPSSQLQVLNGIIRAIQQFAICRVSYVSEWMLFGSNKFSSMTVKEGLSCLVSGIVFLL